MVEAYLSRDYKDMLAYIHNNACILLAGGTDLMVRHRNEAGLLPNFDKKIVFLQGLKEIKGVRREGEQVRIGAGASLSTLLQSGVLPQLLTEALENIASPSIRNVATLGGNINNASPAGDSLPVLYLMDSILVLESVEGIREISIDGYILGPGKTSRQPDEVLKEIRVNEPVYTHRAYKKVGGRKGDAIAKLSFAAVARIESERIVDFRAAFGAVGPVVLRNRKLEHKLIGMKTQELEARRKEILEDYGRLIRPIDDQRSTADYRRKCALRLLEDFLKKLGERDE